MSKTEHGYLDSSLIMNYYDYGNFILKDLIECNSFELQNAFFSELKSIIPMWEKVDLHLLSMIKNRLNQYYFNNISDQNKDLNPLNFKKTVFIVVILKRVVLVLQIEKSFIFFFKFFASKKK